MSGSLKEELASERPADVPAFQLLVPPGWVSERPTRASLGALTNRASAVLKSVHRPDLDAQVRAMSTRAFTQLLRRNPVRFIYPADVAPEDLFPLSILAVEVTDPGGGSLDRRVHELVRSKGAHLFDEDAQLLFWETTDDVDASGAPATVRSFNYLVAVPGTERHQALLFTGTLPLSGGGQRLDDEVVEGARALLHAIMSTFRWEA